MTTDPRSRLDSSRYKDLGLVANPFAVEVEEGVPIGVALETRAAANRLLGELARASTEGRSKPVVVSKTTQVPSFYPMRAISDVESRIINDESLNVLHAYIQLYMLRKGRVRSTLASVGERLVFRSFERTLAAYVLRVLETPDESLPSYAALGPERLSRFAEEAAADPLAAVLRFFGEPELERRPELAEVADLRVAMLDDDVDESEVSSEVDVTIGTAPGTGVALPSAEQESEDTQALVDYLIEYTAVHLSKVIARGLRVYRERGLAALSTELRVTKAPRKTLGAVVKLARARFDKVAIIYDGFENWGAIAPEMRQTIVTSLTEMRWMLGDDAVFVLLLERDQVPELEEQFAGATRVEWDFPWLAELQDSPDKLDLEMVRFWSGSATLLGAADPLAPLEVLANDANGSLGTFVAMASAAIEDAAERGVDAIDDAALEAGRAAAGEEVD